MSYKWKPLQRANVGAIPEALILVWMQQYKCDRARALELIKQDADESEYWINDLYQVQVRREIGNTFVQICIRRRDGAACIRDWRHFQQIKNEILGPDCEAVELYPAESRLTDTSNKYHLWGSSDPTHRFPFGFNDRDVVAKEIPGPPGLRQRRIMKGETT